MANVDTFRIQFLNVPIPADNVIEIKEKLVVPSIGYRDYNVAQYFRRQYQHVEGGEIIFNCKWGYDRTALQKYLEDYGSDKSVAWIIRCGEGPAYDEISCITQAEISEYEIVKYGFEEVVIKMDNNYWHCYKPRLRDKQLKHLVEKDHKQYRIITDGKYRYLTEAGVIDQSVSGDQYVHQVVDAPEYFSDKFGIPIEISSANSSLRACLKELEHFYEKISFYWEGELVFQINSNRFLSYIHQNEHRGFERGDKYTQWEYLLLEQSFCHESFYSNSSFNNCVNRKYLEWKEANGLGKIE